MAGGRTLSLTWQMSHVGAWLPQAWPQSFSDPSRTLAENAGDPRALEKATNVALSAGPGVIKAFHGSP